MDGQHVGCEVDDICFDMTMKIKNSMMIVRRVGKVRVSECEVFYIVEQH